MKVLTTLVSICFLSCFIACQGQTKQPQSQTQQKAVSKQRDTSKQMNLIDEQVKILGQVLDIAGTGEDNPLGDATNYQELIRKMDLPEEQKEMLREQYKVYDLSLDASKKDSLKIMVDKMLNKALEKSKREQ